MKKGITCTPNPITNGLRYLMSIVGLILAINVRIDWILPTAHNGDFMIRGLWIMFAINTLFALWGTPQFTVDDEGLIINLVFMSKRVYWSEVTAVRQDPFQTWIFVKNLTPFHKVLGWLSLKNKAAFMVGPLSTNYRPAIQTIRENIHPQRYAYYSIFGIKRG